MVFGGVAVLVGILVFWWLFLWFDVGICGYGLVLGARVHVGGGVAGLVSGVVSFGGGFGVS